MKTINEIKLLLADLTELSNPLFAELENDARLGVKKAVQSRKKQILAVTAEEERLEKMLEFEKSLYAQGIEWIAGIDEVGRGPLAGPVVAAAVILPKNCKISGLNDSKQVPKAKHREIFNEIQRKALAIGIGRVDNEKIDAINIYEATKVAMLQALTALSKKPEHVLIDAMTLKMELPQTKIIHGDARSASIAAASIVAKVTRDDLMTQFDARYPGYDFSHNAGYGTAKHLTALSNLGITPIHRQSFEPIKSLLLDRKIKES